MSRTQPLSVRESFFHRFLWRVTGFPCEDIERFSLPDLANQVRESLCASSTRGSSWSDCFPRFSSSRQAENLKVRFESHLSQLRRDLSVLASEERFQLAVSSSSPLAAERVQGLRPGEKRRSNQKRIELLVMRYLQRFCTKCETSSFIGPVATGGFRSQPEIFSFHLDPRSYQGVAFVANRVIFEVLAFLRQSMQLLRSLRVRRYSGVSVSSDGVAILPTGRCVRVGVVPAAILGFIEEWTPVSEVCRRFSADDREVLAAAHALISIGAVSDELDLSFHVDNPIEYIREKTRCILHGLPALEKLYNELEGALRDWPLMSSGSRNDKLRLIGECSKELGIPDQHRGGFYSDRLAITEDGECENAHLWISDEWANPFLEELESILRERTSFARSRTGRRRLLIEEAMKRNGWSEVDLPSFIRLSSRGKALSVLSSDLDTQESQMKNAGNGNEVVVLSPDIMFAQRSGSVASDAGLDWIFGDCHSAIGCAGYFVRPMRDRAAWTQDLGSFIRDRIHPMKPVLQLSRFKNKTYYLAAVDGCGYVENGLGAPEEIDLVRHEDLLVRVEPQLHLVQESSGRQVILIPSNSQISADYQQAFCTPGYSPVESREVSSRERKGSVVVRRARWKIELSEAPRGDVDCWTTFVWGQHIRARKELPRWIFAHAESDIKPICIDLANPLLCEELVRLIKKHEEVSVVEMYPSPEHSWIKTDSGRYLGEIRMLYVGKSIS